MGCKGNNCNRKDGCAKFVLGGSGDRSRLNECSEMNEDRCVPVGDMSWFKQHICSQGQERVAVYERKCKGDLVAMLRAAAAKNDLNISLGYILLNKKIFLEASNGFECRFAGVVQTYLSGKDLQDYIARLVDQEDAQWISNDLLSKAKWETRIHWMKKTGKCTSEADFKKLGIKDRLAILCAHYYGIPTSLSVWSSKELVNLAIKEVPHYALSWFISRMTKAQIDRCINGIKDPNMRYSAITNISSKDLVKIVWR